MRFQKEQLVDLLRGMRSRGATELHLKINAPPAYRVNGELQRLDLRPLGHHDTQSVAFALGALAGKKSASSGDCELDFGVEGAGRFRAFLFTQQGTLAAVVHTVAQSIPSLADLDVSLSLPMLLTEGGLWLICGRQREILLAALVHEQTQHHPGHTIVLEEDAGLQYRDGRGIVSVRRIGVDVPDLSTGIRMARRMGADLLVAGDVRSKRAAVELLEAVESGVPVIASMGYTRAADCVPGLARLFEPERRDEVTHRLHNIVRQSYAHPAAALEIVRAQRSGEDAPPLPRAMLAD